MTVDTGNLLDVVEAGHTQALDSGVLEAAIPAHLRGADGQWFTLSLRDRVLYAHRDLELDAFAYEDRSEEHTSELQSLMRISYAVFCLKKNNNHTSQTVLNRTTQY